MFWWKSRRDVKDRSSQREPGSRPRLTDRHVPLSCSKVPTFLKERSDHEVPLTAGPRFQGGSAEGLNEHTHVWSPRFSVYQFQNPRSAVQMKQRGSAAASANTRVQTTSTWLTSFYVFLLGLTDGPLLDGVLGTDCFSNLKVSYYFCSLYSTQFFFLQGPETAVFLRLFGLWLNQRCSLRMHTLTASGRNSYSPYCRFWDILFLFLRHQRLGGLHYCYGVMFYQETVL